MAKELPFFKFEISEYMFGRIQKQPLDVQGTFINLCCRYWHKLGELSYADARLDFTPAHIDALAAARIIKDDEGYVVINFMDEQLNERAEASKVNSIKGKKSAELRAKRRATKSNSGSTAVEIGSTAVQPQSTVVQQRSTEPQPNPTEEKREENIYIYGSGTVSIAIRKTYANEQAKRIFDLRLYFEAEKQLSDLEVKGWIHYQAFIEANAGRVFNDSDHLYNSYRAFCAEYKPPEASKKFEDAEFNKTLWTLQAWEKQYRWMLEHDSEFRKHFGYGELQKGRSMGVRDNGRGRIKGTSGAEG